MAEVYHLVDHHVVAEAGLRVAYHAEVANRLVDGRPAVDGVFVLNYRAETCVAKNRSAEHPCFWVGSNLDYRPNCLVVVACQLVDHHLVWVPSSGVHLE